MALVERISGEVHADRPSASADAAVELAPTLCAAARFLSRTQVGPESALFLPRPRRPLGGFYSGLESPDMRIDTSQHAISALLGLARLLERDRLVCAGFDRAFEGAGAGRYSR